MTEETDPFCLQPVEAAALLYDAPWQRFGVIGDSLSAGTGDPAPGYAPLGWCDRFEGILRSVRPDLAYLNTARVGARTPEVVAEQFDRIRAFRPDLLHLNSGANDIVRRDPDFDEIERELRHMYELAAGTGAQLTVFTLGRAYVVPVFADWHDRLSRLNDITRRLASEFDAVLTDFWDHDFNNRPNLLSADGIHFSTAGQAVIASELVKQLAHRLGSAR
ncbi:SGNH/GDSL hydrolase family protein [Nocardia sp. XZ_19_385]|uniref:SGNH/GDSL hydrolase family protein n=1 Tax=Nocardia sp. XZ_19_385 TaxID=2769488 RepID=UPI001E427354|nr:SGNH/GDSL hydrolase family protein [Nocardia sp. XZ_19_385]